MRFDRTVQIAPTRAEFDTRQRHAFAILQRVAAGPAAALVPLHPWLCDARRCRVVGSDGAPLYFDDDHLSRAGARVVAPAVEPIFSTTTQYRAAEAQ
jgi:lysophospholipase L1-like esterase